MVSLLKWKPCSLWKTFWSTQYVLSWILILIAWSTKITQNNLHKVQCSKYLETYGMMKVIENRVAQMVLNSLQEHKSYNESTWNHILKALLKNTNKLQSDIYIRTILTLNF